MTTLCERTRTRRFTRPGRLSATLLFLSAVTGFCFPDLLSGQASAGIGHFSPACNCGMNPKSAAGFGVLTSGYQAGHAAAGCCGICGGIPHFTAASGLHYSGLGLSWNTHHNGPAYTGYEGLPLMDGTGVNYRYPYHSYRRPWFHPGPAAANISIVW